MALRMITRAQTLHECLHLLYSTFPPKADKDPKCNTGNQKKTMAMISNIIEDAYIEAVGSSVYDNLEIYLKFARVSRLFLTHDSEGTADRVFKRKITKKDVFEKPNPVSSGEAIRAYLDYMATMLLYPMVKQSEPKEIIKGYVEENERLFMAGSHAPSPDERYQYAQEIFDLIFS